MTIYVTISLIIVILGLFNKYIRLRNPVDNVKKNLPNYFFIVPTFLLLFIVSTFRGSNLTSDYKSYDYLFSLYNQYEFFQTFQVGLTQEIGYIFLSRLIGIFTDNSLFIFGIVAFLILLFNYLHYSKYSTYLWLSILMFVTVGSFYPSFNIMRQVLAASIVFAGSKYLYERKAIKYFIIVALASLFHQSALIMIIFYFILNLKIKLRNLTILSLSSFVVITFLDIIIAIIQNISYSYYTEDAYGVTGYAFSNVVLPIAFLIFSLYHHKKLDKNSVMHTIWLNAVFFNAFFSVLGLQFQLIERLSHFFAPYAFLLIPYIFSKMKYKELRVIYMISLIILLILYNYIVLSGTDYDPYYFIWEE